MSRAWNVQLVSRSPSWSADSFGQSKLHRFVVLFRGAERGRAAAFWLAGLERMSLFDGQSFISADTLNRPFASDVLSTPVIELFGPTGWSLSCWVLHVLQGHVLAEYIRVFSITRMNKSEVASRSRQVDTPQSTLDLTSCEDPRHSVYASWMTESTMPSWLNPVVRRTASHIQHFPRLASSEFFLQATVGGWYLANFLSRTQISYRSPRSGSAKEPITGDSGRPRPGPQSNVLPCGL